jgi:hypothetical protein
MDTAKRHVSGMGMEGDMYQIWVQKEIRIIYGHSSKTCTIYGGMEKCVSNMGTSWNRVPEMGTERSHV